MSNITPSKHAVVIAVRTMLRPIVRLMIGMGFSARDFIEVTKTVYTEVATKEYGKRGRNANTSRVALLTGLTRREVARLQKVSYQDPLFLADPVAPLGHVLASWHQQAEFLDEHGRPKVLALKPTFMDLVNEHRGDVPATTVVKELLAHNAIEIRDDRVKALTRYFMPFELKPQAVERFGRVIGDVGDTIYRNLLLEDRSKASFEGRASNELVAVTSADAFRKFLDRRAMEFLEEVDNWLSDHSDPEAQESTRLGVGVYTIGGIE
jgi:hypothetical protein